MKKNSGYTLMEVLSIIILLGCVAFLVILARWLWLTAG